MKKVVLILGVWLITVSNAMAQIGSLSSDLVFTPITPCRIVDTRSAGGVIPAGNSRVFKGWAANYTAQGGKSDNCGLPQTTDIAALAVNMLVIVPAAEGWIAAWPTGTSMPLVSNLNYKANDVLANSAILKINQTTADFNVYTVASTHLAVDVTGYYSKPISLGSLECVNTTPVTNTINQGPANGLYYNNVGANNCAAGYTAIALNCTTNNMIYAWAVGSSVSSVTCGGLSTASGYSVSASLKCCRVPGR